MLKKTLDKNTLITNTNIYVYVCITHLNYTATQFNYMKLIQLKHNYYDK